MKFKVHWIIDGIAEIDGESKEDAEKKLQESLEEYVKNSEDLMNKFIAKSISESMVLVSTSSCCYQLSNKPYHFISEAIFHVE